MYIPSQLIAWDSSRNTAYIGNVHDLEVTEFWGIPLDHPSIKIFTFKSEGFSPIRPVMFLKEEPNT